MFVLYIVLCKIVWYTLFVKLNIRTKCRPCRSGTVGEKGIGCKSRAVNSRRMYPNVFIVDESQSLGNREGIVKKQGKPVGYKPEDLL